MLQVFAGALTGFVLITISVLGVWSFCKSEEPINRDYRQR